MQTKITDILLCAFITSSLINNLLITQLML